MRGKPKLVVIGASGFIGTALCSRLVDDYAVTILTRSRARMQKSAHADLAWAHCDLYEPRQVACALEGFEYAIYLVNNLVPSARLSQAQCRDMDVLVADNVGRAAASAGIRQVVTLGLLIPQGDIPQDLAEHREEVPCSLGAAGTPVTTLRAGLIVGPGGNLVRLVADLATRLPVIVLPRWANGRKQPIALTDVVRAILRVVGDPATYNQSFDLGGPRVLDVRSILHRASKIFDRRRPVLLVPLLPAFLYRGWVRMLSPASHPDLVRRTVAALRYDTLARDNPLQRAVAADAAPARMALERSGDRHHRAVSPSPRSSHLGRDEAELRAERRARSIQRLTLPGGRNAQWIAEHYFAWLPRFFLHLIETRHDEGDLVRFVMRFPKLDLLRMRCLRDQCTGDRMVYRIEGGILAAAIASRTARLEFREVLGGRAVIAAIHDYRPTLPWHVYRFTQSIVHLLAMNTYAWHLRRLARRAARQGDSHEQRPT